MAANYGRPRPVDPLHYREDMVIAVRCGCGHSAKLHVGFLARRFGLSRDMMLETLVERLRCVECGRRRPTVDLDASKWGRKDR